METNDPDPWLGSIMSFPAVLHAQATYSSEVDSSNLQKSIVAALRTLSNLRLPIELSLSDRDGYLNGLVSFKLGVGNAEAFDLLDHAEEDRLLKRIENRGPFASLDLAFNLHYNIDDGKRHTVRDDRFLARLLFRSGRMEIYVHHLKGMRRVQPEEIISLLVEQIDANLERTKHSRLQPENTQVKTNRLANLKIGQVESQHLPGM